MRGRSFASSAHLLLLQNRRAAGAYEFAMGATLWGRRVAVPSPPPRPPGWLRPGSNGAPTPRPRASYEAPLE